MKKFLIVPALAVPFLLASCGQAPSTDTSTAPTPPAPGSTQSVSPADAPNQGPQGYKASGAASGTQNSANKAVDTKTKAS